IADARLEVEAALEGREPALAAATSPPAPSERAARLLPWAVAIAFAAIALWQARPGRRDEGELVRLSVALPEGAKLEPLPALQNQQIAISPDGRRIAFFAWAGGQGTIFVRELSGRSEMKPIANLPDGGDLFFSPDGKWIGFVAEGQLRKVAVGGGTPVALAP